MYYEDEDRHYDDPTVLTVDPLDSDEEDQLEQQRSTIKQRFEQRKQNNAAKPPQQLNVDRVLYEFLQSEVEQDTFEMIAQAWKEEYNGKELQVPAVPRQFDYVESGSERHNLRTSTYKQLNNYNKQQLQQQQQALVEINKTVQKNLSNAIAAVQKYETNTLKQNSGKDLSWFLGEGFTMLSLHVAFNKWPLYHYVPNPVAIKLPAPYGDMSTAEILVIAENKERKNQFKEALNADKSIGLRIMRWDRLNAMFKSVQIKQKLASGYDLVFVDANLKDVYQTLDKPFFTKNPVPVLLPEKIEDASDAIANFISGTPVYIPRGLDVLSIPIGYAQMNASELKSNADAILKEVGKFLPGGYENILSIDVSSQQSPKLPVYLNEKLSETRFKVGKQFKKKPSAKLLAEVDAQEKQAQQQQNDKTKPEEDDGEDMQE